MTDECTDFQISSTPDYVGVFWRGSALTEKGVAEASLLDIPEIGPCWYINRVLIQPPGSRSGGIGSRLVGCLKSQINKQGGSCMFVTPGGYTSSKKDLFRFYTRCGFSIHDPQGSMLMRW